MKLKYIGLALACAVIISVLNLRVGQAASSLQIAIRSNGPDANQQSQFAYQVKNTGTAAVTGISVRIYFNIDNGNAASNYVLEKYWDQSGAATVSSPTLLSGSTYYFTVNYGTASLAAGGSWEYQTSLHLANWGSNFDSTNDWFHTGYATGALPAAYTNTNYIPAYVSGTLVWGSEPGGSSASATPTKTGSAPPPTATNTVGIPTNTSTATKTNTPGTPTFIPPTATRTASPTNTVSVPTNTATATKTNTPSTPTATPLPGTHLANPFAGAKWFINPAWAAEINAATGSALTASQKATVSSQNTAVWLDSMAAVNGTNGYPYSITGWLDQAVSQKATLIIFVVYDLPQRDCAALASNGEIPGTAAGLTTYETSYIDPIAAAEGQAKYSGIRIINIVEPDSLPNLVTNLSMSNCANANNLNLYKNGITYALNKLHPIANTYNYLDIGHSGWLGWSSNFGPAITLISGVIKGTTAGVSSVDGFISDTANTVPVTEPYMTATQQVGGQPVQSVTFYSYNPYIEEDTYDAAWASAMQGAGLPASSTNMLVDTSRNGWGGCGGGPNVSQNCRPTGASTATDVATFVTQTRIDRRPARGDWCNQNGAGIGARPQANPAGGVYQAYVWIKPPGESDGSSSLIPTGPQNPGGKGFDQMCDPSYGGNSLNQNSPTNALPNAPVSGAWFEAQFDQLVANAYPAIP
jgi:cellulose 1,4-beta-cellobiosidase